MPTRQRPRLIGRALASVLRQDIADTVILVLDNASGDETEAVVAAYARHDSRVQYIRRPENIGLEANFADGLERVTTPYAAFLPDDDFLLPGCYRSAVDALDEDSKLGFVALRMVYANPDATYSIESSMRSGRYESPDGMLEMLRHRHRTWMGTVFRTACRDSGIRLEPTAGPILDLDFQLRIASRYAILAIDALGAVYATGPSPANHLKWNPWHDRIESHLREHYGLAPEIASAAAVEFHQRRCVDLFKFALTDLAAGGTSVPALAESLLDAGAPGRATLARTLLGSRAFSRPAVRLALGIRHALRHSPKERLALSALVNEELAQLESIADRISPGAWGDAQAQLGA